MLTSEMSHHYVGRLATDTRRRSMVTFRRLRDISMKLQVQLNVPWYRVVSPIACQVHLRATAKLLITPITPINPDVAPSSRAKRRYHKAGFFFSPAETNADISPLIASRRLLGRFTRGFKDYISSSNSCLSGALAGRYRPSA